MMKAGSILPVQQGELFEVDASWFHVFRDFVISGQLASMSGSSTKVYLVIRAYANPASGNSFPSVETIAEKTGLSEAQVKRELVALEQGGHINKRKDGRRNVYQLLDKWPIKNSATGEVVRRVEVVPYIPKMVEAITRKLKAAIDNGTIPSSGIINLNLNMPVTINVANEGGVIIAGGQPGQAEGVTIDMDAVEASLELLPPTIRESMEKMRPSGMRRQEKEITGDPDSL